MKNFIFCFLFLFFMGFHYSLFSQIIVEQSYTSPSNSIAKFKPVFNKENYTKRYENSYNTVYLKNHHNNVENNSSEVNLTVQLDYDTESYMPISIAVMDENGFFYEDFFSGEDSKNLSVSPGNYDILIQSYIIEDGDISGNSYFVKELIEVNADKSVVIDLADSQNRISAEIYNENGELLEPGIISEDWTEVIGGNADVLATNMLLFNPTNEIVSIFIGNWGFKIDEDDRPNDFYINDVSDRYKILQDRIAISYDVEFYFTKYDHSTTSSSMTFQNDPENYVLHKEKFQPSPVGASEGSHYSAFSTNSTWKGNSTSMGWEGYNVNEAIDMEEGVQFHLDNPISGDMDNLEFDVLINPGFVDHVITIEEEDGWIEEIPVIIYASPIILEPNKEVFHLINGSYYAGNFSFNITPDGEIPFLSPHPQFSYGLQENPQIIQGDNVAIASVIAQNYYDETTPGKMSFIIPQYIGRYGDIKNAYYDNISVEIKYNGQEIFSDDYSQFDSFMWDWLQQSNPDGLLDITFTNTNFKVDELAGKNITHITYDWTKEDWTPPTLQMLQFRNSEEEIVHKFISTEEGTVRLAAGDFDYIDEPFHFEYNEGNTVEFYYSAYDQDSWTEIELTEYPEYFQMPAFGDYYEASLEEVAVPEDNMWFDVKIISTDAAGNTQEQVISPAFKVENKNMGIDEVDPTGFRVYPNPTDDILNIKMTETIDQIDIYSLTGQLIQTERPVTNEAQINIEKLQSGVYLMKVRTQENTQTVRVLKK